MIIITKGIREETLWGSAGDIWEICIPKHQEKEGHVQSNQRYPRGNTIPLEEWRDNIKNKYMQLLLTLKNILHIKDQTKDIRATQEEMSWLLTSPIQKESVKQHIRDQHSSWYQAGAEGPRGEKFNKSV